MPQLRLPMFPHGVTDITPDLAVKREADQVTYYHGMLPVFSHGVDDVATFRMITSQFCVQGHAKQIQIVKAFDVPPISVKRAVKRFREDGPGGFYTKRRGRGAAVLTKAVLAEAQELFDEGLSTSEVAKRLGLKRDTLAKAVRADRVHKKNSACHGSVDNSQKRTQ